jgi:hypothetical protein
VRGGGHAPLRGQHREKCLHVLLAKSARVPHPGPANVHADPVDVRLFRAQAVVQVARARVLVPAGAAALQLESTACGFPYDFMLYEKPVINGLPAWLLAGRLFGEADIVLIEQVYPAACQNRDCVI